MALENGTTLGIYEIVAPLGAGGMGEVYRAHDTKLERDVAIKVLPDRIYATSFSLVDGKVKVLDGAEDERLSQFEAEARLLASLNHANVATLYGFETRDDVAFLVMEMVEGTTLGQKLKEGPLKIRETLRIFSQIADGLEAAHERGIAHCDLKPQNIMVTPRGDVKILDFGVARALSGPSEPSTVDPDEVPTLPAMTLPGSHTGTGTIVYMSPEQARGERGDRRADIWAFGCCLFESLTGKRAFFGPTIPDTIVQIIERDPEFDELPERTPRRVRDLLRHCLSKEPSERLRSVGDAALSLRDALQQYGTPDVDESGVAPSPEAGGNNSAWRWIPAATIGLAIGLVGALLMPSPTKSVPQNVRRLSINLPTDHPLQPSIPISPHRGLALSSDGKILVYVAQSGDTTQLFRRQLDQTEALPLVGTEGAWYPFFSPDDRWVGFFNRESGTLEKVPLSGGLPELITTLVPSGVASQTAGLGATWLTDGTIVYSGAANQGLRRVSEDGGESTLVSPVADGELYRGFPSSLPGGHDVLVMFGDSVAVGRTQVGRVDLETGELTPLYERASMARYIPTGHIVFSQLGQLMAAPFDLDTLTATGPPVQVTEPRMHTGVGDTWEWAFSDSGVMIYATANEASRIGREALWVDRSGNAENLEINGVTGGDWARLSADGTQAVHGSIDDSGNWDVYLYDIETGTSRRLTVDRELDTNPIFHPDGKRVFFSGVRGQGRYLFELDLGGGPPRRLGDAPLGYPRSVSADGKLLFFESPSSSDSREDIGAYSLDNGTTQMLLATPYAERYPTLSPDGKWLAFESDLSDRSEIYVQPYPALDAPRQISSNGGNFPVWSASGTELYYRRGRALVSVPVDLSEGATFGPPEVLFESDFGVQNYAFDATPDGLNFLMLRPATRGVHELIVVENWFEELKRRSPLDPASPDR